MKKRKGKKKRKKIENKKIYCFDYCSVNSNNLPITVHLPQPKTRPFGVPFELCLKCWVRD